MKECIDRLHEYMLVTLYRMGDKATIQEIMLEIQELLKHHSFSRTESSFRRAADALLAEELITYCYNPSRRNRITKRDRWTLYRITPKGIEALKNVQSIHTALWTHVDTSLMNSMSQNKTTDNSYRSANTSIHI